MALRAIYNDGKKQSVGSVRGMWSSGVVVETDVRAGIGSPFALVILSGGFDGARLSAEVAGVDKSGLMLHLPGLDGARFSRLRALVEGKPLPSTPLPQTQPKQPPPNVPSFIISGGDDDDEYLLADPTGLVVLGPEDQKGAKPPDPVHELREPKTREPSPSGKNRASPKKAPAPIPMGPVPESPLGDKMSFDIPGPVTDPFARAKVTTTEAELESQVVELGRKNALLLQENKALHAENANLRALKTAVEEELADATAKLDEIEKIVRR